MKKYTKYLILPLVIIAVASAANLLAHTSARLHTGQTASYKATAGKDADIDGASNHVEV